MNELFLWQLNIPVVIGVLVAECVYVLLVERLWRKTGSYDMRAAWAWTAGLLLIFVAFESPLDALGEQHLLAVHMVQHELLLSVAPLLLLLGLFPRLIIPVTRPVFKLLLRNRGSYAVLRILFSPYYAIVLWLAVIYLWHLPSLYMQALYNSTIHIIEHVSLILIGTLFWLPIIEPVPGLTKMRPLPKLLYIAAGQFGMVPLVVVLLWSPILLYSYYQGRSTLWGLTHLADQHLAGMLMMTIDMTVALTTAIWIVLKTLSLAEWQDKRPRPSGNS